MGRFKPPGVQIVQIAPAMNDKFGYLFGLGDNSLPYYWDAVETEWVLYYEGAFMRFMNNLEDKSDARG